MRAANKNILLPFAAVILFVVLLTPRVHAQTFGGSTSTSLFGASSSSTFQSPGGAQQGGATAQGSSAAVLQTTGVTAIKVTGAAPSAATVSDESYEELNSSEEMVILAVFAGLFAVGVLVLLTRQIKNSY